jgi:hypothetical protein
VLVKRLLCYVISLNSVAKPIESLSDCRWLAELETEGLSSIAKERLFDTCCLGGGGQYRLEKRSKMLNGFVRALAFRANFSIACFC